MQVSGLSTRQIPFTPFPGAAIPPPANFSAKKKWFAASFCYWRPRRSATHQKYEKPDNGNPLFSSFIPSACFLSKKLLFSDSARVAFQNCICFAWKYLLFPNYFPNQLSWKSIPKTRSEHPYRPAATHWTGATDTSGKLVPSRPAEDTSWKIAASAPGNLISPFRKSHMVTHCRYPAEIRCRLTLETCCTLTCWVLKNAYRPLKLAYRLHKSALILPKFA